MNDKDARPTVELVVRRLIERPATIEQLEADLDVAGDNLRALLDAARDDGLVRVLEGPHLNGGHPPVILAHVTKRGARCSAPERSDAP